MISQDIYLPVRDKHFSERISTITMLEEDSKEQKEVAQKAMEKEDMKIAEHRRKHDNQ